MARLVPARTLALALGLLALASCKQPDAPVWPNPVQPRTPRAAKATPRHQIEPGRLAAFSPLPADMLRPGQAASEELIALGRMLYYEKRLSKNQEISCNTCHDLAKFGVDGKPTSPGHKGQLGTRNSPTVYNAALHFVQFWDGREPTVEAQAKGPILNPVEMGMPDEKRVLAVLGSMPEYVELFKKAFPADKDPVTYDNVGNAIGAFERRLVTPGRWDRFLKGEQAALSDEEKVGFNTFTDAGCVACHLGPAVGGTLYQKLGLMEAWPGVKDQGRFEATKAVADRLMFKVPSLRLITHTGPYLHDGGVPSLDQVVTLMARHQAGRKLEAKDVQAIVAFLGALTGDLPTAYIQEPALPKSGPKTPKADPT